MLATAAASQRSADDHVEDDESRIFASLQATAVDQSSYEQKVAEGAAVPPLVLSSTYWGFPPTLANDLLADGATTTTPDQAITVLERLLQQQVSKSLSSLKTTNPSADENEKEDIDRMKRSILEHALDSLKQQTGRRKRTDDGGETIQKKKKSRISMMQRKEQEAALLLGEIQAPEKKQIDPEQQKQLISWREERTKRRQARRAKRQAYCASSDDDDEEELENKKETESLDVTANEKQASVPDSVFSEKRSSTTAPDSVTSLSSPATDEKVASTPDTVLSSASPMVKEGEKVVPAVVTCPICQATIDTPLEGDMSADALLAQHMSTCSGGGRATRSRGRLKAETLITPQNVPSRKKKPRSSKKPAPKRPDETAPIDDSLLDDYEDRIDTWMEQQAQNADSTTAESTTLPGGLWIPPWSYSRLFPYQRVGVDWLWRLHRERNGGIVGDEMGLGKTVQIAAFLGAAAASRKLKSVLIVAPGTLLVHWLRELAIWAPGLRRILARSAPPNGGSLREWLQHARRERWNEALDEKDWEEKQTWCGTGYCVVTTYEQLRRNAEAYCQQHTWSYVVLDEAQQIRNPDAEVTVVCKQLRTPHRLAMTGTPIQNDLRELWSLVDFCFPGRLGTLPAFEQEFAIPIKRGGYANARPTQVQLAYRCALQVRELVEPFLLRRLKRDIPEVQMMPGKTEQVLFCRLSARQREMYEAYLQSDDVLKIVRRQRGNNNNGHQLLKATTVLRKITNHPDLVCDPSQAAQFVQTCGGIMANTANSSSDSEDDLLVEEESLVARSGKLEVLSKILPLWYKQGHRVLIFCQWRKMLNIIQSFITMKGYKFGRLDGNTNVNKRQQLVDTFNNDKSYMGLLCTTRTGGVGLNLTGADRIILYDPDWNPSSDAQARERAWRFGQTRPVTIYRLITAGTIEEKMYHRQIFKTALSNKILQDPRQQRLFSQRDLCDLFTLGSDTGSVRGGGDGVTDTTLATQGVGNVTDEADERVTLKAKDDNDMTLKKVMKSKGLAGIFDHDTVEPGGKRKSGTEQEIEKHAKKVAREAVKALQASVGPERQVGVPTWTGSSITRPGRFGAPQAVVVSKKPLGSQNLSSSGLLASIRQQNISVQMDGEEKTDSNKYALLLGRLKKFVRLENPTTDEILHEFSAVPDSDMSIFRRLLKSVALMDEESRWSLR